MPSLKQRVTWESFIPILTNRFFLYDTLKIVLFSLALFTLIFVPVFLGFQGIQAWPILYQFLGFLALVFLGLVSLALLLMTTIYRNHLRARFTITEERAEYETLSPPAQWLTYALLVITILTGRIGDAGMGLLVTAKAKLGINWREVYRVKEHPQQQVITLLNNWRTVLRLYCTPENYGEVAAMVSALAAEGTAWRTQHHLKPGRLFPRRLLFLTVLTLLGGLFLFLIPFRISPIWATGIMICGSLLIWLPGWNRFFGSLTLIGAVALLNLILIEGFKITRSIGLIGAPDSQPEFMVRQYGFQSLIVGEWINLLLASTSLGFFVWLAVSALRGSLYQRRNR
ncbi:MAG: hypothetical protein JST84_23675 [Acidobacteria bacterium]|nr:hypothetical protein [Acidobacteriota bacterium]